jgi:hypothetical protein
LVITTLTCLNNFFGQNPIDVFQPGGVRIIERQVFDFHWIVKSEKILKLSVALIVFSLEYKV